MSHIKLTGFNIKLEKITMIQDLAIIMIYIALGPYRKENTISKLAFLTQHVIKYQYAGPYLW